MSWERALLVLLVLVVGGLAAAVPGFFDGVGSFLQLTENFLPFGLVAFGLATVILTGGIDLSVGATAGLSAIVMAELWSGLGVSIWLAAIGGVACGAVLGAINGLIITRLRTEPLIATLATTLHHFPASRSHWLETRRLLDFRTASMPSVRARSGSCRCRSCCLPVSLLCSWHCSAIARSGARWR